MAPGYFDAALPPDSLPDLGFTLVSQKVDLTIDFASQSLSGTTEITIQPNSKDLKSVRLHCRQSRILAASIEGRNAAVAYRDPYEKLKVRGRTTVHQHDALRSKLEKHIKESPEPELVLTVPARVHIQELQSEFALAISRDSSKRQDDDAAETPTTSHAQEPLSRYAPLKVLVEFEIKNFRDGLHFVGFGDDDGRYPHLYTKNTLGPGTTCSIFPCVDDATTRCMWEISIRCPKTLGDAFRKPKADITATSGRQNGHANGSLPDEDTVMTGISHRDDYLIPLGEEERALDLNVVCSGDMTDDIVDAQDSTWRTVSFMQVVPVCARHIGFAIGPFEHVDLSEFREVDEDDKLGQNAIKVDGFCLPGRSDELRNTCMPMAKAIDYFTVNYGSFPFSGYKLCFVDDLIPDATHTASLSICSNRLLFPEDIIEPLDPHTRILVHALASQYVGVNIIPKETTDMWTITGISGFMTDIFMKKLAGNNEYRFRQKLASEKVYELDFERYSIHQLGAQLDIDPSEYDFLALKSALILFILDRRLTKASGAAGVSRIVTRLFLNAKTGDLVNGELSTDFFHRLCEKLGHQKLDAFFRQWVYGAGCPIFHVSQRFNKKKLVVEMIITQKQMDRKTKPKLEPANFMREVKEQVSEAWAPGVQPVFTGPMTIRIHEADGTPYEHIVEVKDAITKIEIPYNTKYKRLKRSKRAKERAMASGTLDLGGDAENDVLLYCLGDVLQAEDEVRDWRLTDWSKDDEDRMGQESYEWIRMDADFEWIGKIQLIMPVYMYVSQLQQDRDVVAQYESLQYVAAQYPHPLMSTILIRTLMDRRYFHGIRTLAAVGLARCAREDLSWIGQFHLEKAFHEFFCFSDSPMPRANDFSDRTTYLIQCAIPKAMSRIRDSQGKVPMSVRRFFVDKMKFNDNSNNEFSDCFYISTLMQCLTNSLVASARPPPRTDGEFDDDDLLEEYNEDLKFQTEAIGELERYRRIDEWISSYQNIYSVTALNCMQQLQQVGIVKNKTADMLQYTQPGNADEVRLKAFSSLVDLKVARRPQVLKYLLHSLCDDPSPFFRDRLSRVLGQALGSVAIKDEEEEKPQPKPVVSGGLILEQETLGEIGDLDMIGRSPPELALIGLKAALAEDQVFKKALWHAAQAPAMTISEVVSFLDIAALLYEPSTQLIATLRLPRFYRVKHLGKGKMRFAETERYRTAPRTGISVEIWQLVQLHGLKYTGPLSKAVKEHQNQLKVQAREQKQEAQALEAKIAAANEKLQRQQAAQAQKPIHVATAMSPPPLPTPVSERPGPKISLKRKQSSTDSRASSPKREKLSHAANGTTPAPKTKRSPSVSKQRAPTPSQGSITVASGPARQSMGKGQKSLMVRLKTRSLGRRIEKILSKPSRNGKGGETPSRISTSTPSAAAATPALTQASNADFFSSPSVVSAVQNNNFGGFRSWGGHGSSSVKKEDTDSAPPSAISPTSQWPPKIKPEASRGGTMSPSVSTGAGEDVAKEKKKPSFKIKLGKKNGTS